jgi:hypothetical protein
MLEAKARSAEIEKEKPKGGIKWHRVRALKYDTSTPMPTFNEFYNEQLKEFKKGLIDGTLGAYDRVSPNSVLIEQHNVERTTTQFRYFIEPDQLVQLEDHMHEQRRIDRPDYYMTIKF